MQTKSWRRLTQTKGIYCKPSRDENSRKPRALLCKPSRDRVSRKPRAFYAKQDRYTRKSEYELVRYSLGKEGKRNKARKRTKIGQQTRKYRQQEGLSSYTHPGTQWWALKRWKYRFTFNAILFFVKSIVALHFSKLSPLISSYRWFFLNLVHWFYRSDKFFETKSVNFIVAIIFSKLSPLILL